MPHIFLQKLYVDAGMNLDISFEIQFSFYLLHFDGYNNYA